MENPELTVSAAWLVEHLHDANLRIFDATYHLPAAGRNALAEFLEKHIPYACFFDIDTVADDASDLPHMLPSADHFARAVEALGMTGNHYAVVYDTHGLMSAARLWWMFRVFGYDRVAVLDGGLPAWIAAGGSVEAGVSDVAPASAGAFLAHLRPELIASQADVREQPAAVLDARGSARFAGTMPEPRPGVRQGHIPGSTSLPYTELLDGGYFLDNDALRRRFTAAGVRAGERVIASCGSGVTACVLALGLAKIGRPDVAVYDGSWAEWGADPEASIAVGDTV